MSTGAAYSYLATYGGQLLEKGFPIIPIKPGYKFPYGLKKWERIEADEKKLNAWLSNGFANAGVGILTKNFPAVDLDVRDKEIVEKLVAWCEKKLGKTIQRIGKAPKTLLVFRTDSPFPKVSSKTYIDFLDQEHKVEILGDGQQFVAYHIHPETKSPYQWVDDVSLVDVDINSIPVITRDLAFELVEFFESIIPEDWDEKHRSSKSKEIDYSLSVDDRILLNAKPKVDLPTQKIKIAVNLLDPDMHHDDWFRVGMALFHQFDGGFTGFEIWDEWSAKGAKYNSAEMEKRWASFKADLSRQEPITCATIIKMAKEARKQQKASEVKRSGFNLVHAKDILAKLGPISWQVKNFFEANTTGLLFGDPGCFKSFLALDVGLHCAAGKPWHGNEVTQGPVIYVAGEGHGGFARRLAAFQKANDINLSKIPFYFSEQAASFYNEESAIQVTSAIDEIANVSSKPVMIVIDTLARNFGPGDENSTSDMNVYIDHIDSHLRARYQCTVLIVHHTGHANKERARGAMALKGALDFEFRVTKPEGMQGYLAQLHCTKMKDAVEPEDTWFEGESIVVGNFDEDEMTSLVFRKTEAPVQEEPKLRGKQKACFELLKSSVIDGAGIDKKALQKLMIDEEVSESNNQARNVINSLLEKGYLVDYDGFISIEPFYE